MWGLIARLVGTAVVFVLSLVAMAVVCIWAWDAFVNGKLYYCTDGGSMDFICVGDWVHHPESVAHVVPRTMSESDEIKNGWTITRLWLLWDAFVGGSVLFSAWVAFTLWRITGPNKAADEGRIEERSEGASPQ